MDPTRAPHLATRRPAARVRDLAWVAVLTAAALAASGCSKFYDLPDASSGEVVEDVPTDSPISDGEGDGADDADALADASDGRADSVTDAPDATDAADAPDAADVPDAADATDAADAADAADVPTCEDPCEEPGLSRCAPARPPRSRRARRTRPPGA